MTARYYVAAIRIRSRKLSVSGAVFSLPFTPRESARGIATARAYDVRGVGSLWRGDVGGGILRAGEPSDLLNREKVSWQPRK
jgi:hypothetical protein